MEETETYHQPTIVVLGDVKELTLLINGSKTWSED